MPASNNQPSEKLTKLKLHLEKVKTDLSRENTDLQDWLKDRDIKIDKFSYPKEKKNSTDINLQGSVDQKVVEAITTNKKLKDKSLLSSVSDEEYASIMDKMSQLLDLPAGQLEEQSELYLEQQLSDILGFEITAEIDDIRLTHNTGIMEAESHLKRFPADKLESHENHLEAGLSTTRSAFGWFTNLSQPKSDDTENEKYYISIPLYYYPSWNENYVNLKTWYKYRKVIVINPNERVAVVAVVGNINPSTTLKYQFGGSPEVIRETKIWSQKSAGKVLILFVDDSENKIPLGPVHFDKFFKDNN